jgi:hypothetical protein
MKTVFVIGAGASKEFDEDNSHNMPVGSEMAIAIENLVERDLNGGGGPIATALDRGGGFTPHHRNAMERIRDGINSKDSIDDFLSEWNDVREIGRVAKLCIAHVILEAERKSILGQMVDGHRQQAAPALRLLKRSWLGIIADLARPSVRRRDVREVFRDIGFVTFNYDRCIQQYLLSRCTSTLALSSDEAREAVGAIPILHAYGSLGDLVDPSNQVQFGGKDWELVHAAQGICTYTEDVDSKRINDIRHLIFSADKLVFLGCAYHPQNLSLLFGDAEPSKGWLIGTSFGMRDRQVAAATKDLLQHVHAVTLEGVTCRELLTQRDDEIFRT